jgi:hypothetical protein
LDVSMPMRIIFAMDGSRVEIFDNLILADSRRSGAVHPNSKRRRACNTKSVVYWVPALARRAKPGLLGRNDTHWRVA